MSLRTSMRKRKGPRGRRRLSGTFLFLRNGLFWYLSLESLEWMNGHRPGECKHAAKDRKGGWWNSENTKLRG